MCILASYISVKKMHTVGFFYLFELYQIFQQFHLYSSIAQSSTMLCPKLNLICSKLESVISRVKIYCLHPGTNTLYTVDAPEKEKKQKKKKKKKKKQKEKRIQLRLSRLFYLFNVTLRVPSIKSSTLYSASARKWWPYLHEIFDIL